MRRKPIHAPEPAAQKGALWWAAHHRFSDQPEDVHSPKKGFWWRIDVPYYVLKLLVWVELFGNLRRPPRSVLELNRIADGKPDIGMMAPQESAVTAGPSGRGCHRRRHGGPGPRSP